MCITKQFHGHHLTDAEIEIRAARWDFPGFRVQHSQDQTWKCMCSHFPPVTFPLPASSSFCFCFVFEIESLFKAMKNKSSLKNYLKMLQLIHHSPLNLFLSRTSISLLTLLVCSHWFRAKVHLTDFYLPSVPSAFSQIMTQKFINYKSLTLV